MAEDSSKDSSEHYILVDRRSKGRRVTDNCDDALPECAAGFANLEIRVQTLEKERAKTEKKLSVLYNSVSKLYQLKQMVIAWAIAAGTIASFIYSNLTTIKSMFK